MGMPSIMELLILLIIPLILFFLSLLYSYITVLTLRYFSKKTLPIKELWKKFFYIIILSKAISWLFGSILKGFHLVSLENEPINLIDIIIILFSVLVTILLIQQRIKDKEQKSIGYKISTAIVIINYIVYFIAIVIYTIILNII